MDRSETRIVRAVLAIALLGLACERSAAPQPPDTAAPVAQAEPRPAVRNDGLEVVTDRSLVCMVNDHFMGQPQRPVVVNERTYYGCCPMCEEKLGRDESVRTVPDPVTQRPVDKALAVIVKTKTGQVLYFESDETLGQYRARSAPN